MDFLRHGAKSELYLETLILCSLFLNSSTSSCTRDLSIDQVLCLSLL